MARYGLAEHDPSAVEQSCNGWYWSVLPAIFIGLSIRFAGGCALHVFNRDKQTKKPLSFVMRRDTKVCLAVVGYSVALLGLIIFTTWLMMRDVGNTFDEREQLAAEFEKYLEGSSA